MRNTKGHAGNRRSHHALEELRFSNCPKCNALHLRHKACNGCGNYKGREVIDVMKKVLKKEKKNEAMKEASKQNTSEKKPEKKEKEASLESLSKK